MSQAKDNATITLEQLGKKAKKYKRAYNREHPEAPITLQQAQDVVARQYRFNNYHHAVQVLSNQVTPETDAGGGLIPQREPVRRQ